MLSPDGSPSTAHSLNPVPLIVTARGVHLRRVGTLADVAPTVLDLLGIQPPSAMTGRSLIEPWPGGAVPVARLLDESGSPRGGLPTGAAAGDGCRAAAASLASVAADSSDPSQEQR
jgi:Metalloenzyme superfamily